MLPMPRLVAPALLLALSCVETRARWTSYARMHTSYGTGPLEPMEGACQDYGTILSAPTATSVASCEAKCALASGCTWFAYCPDHLDPALPTTHDTTDCNLVAYNGNDEPLSKFGVKRNRCILYKECRRVGLNLYGNLNYRGFWVFQYSERSVMTGAHTDFFPEQLPEPLKRKHFVPDSLHPSLKFWFAPETLRQQGYVHGARIPLWKNIANICYPGHPDVYEDGANVTQPSVSLGQCSDSFVNSFQRGQRSSDYGVAQSFLQLVGNAQKEIMLQNVTSLQPVFNSEAANGVGAVRFKRGDAAGTSGKYMYIFGGSEGFYSRESNMFSGKGDANTPVPAYRGRAGEFTVLLVFKTETKPGSVGNMGILNVVGSKFNSTSYRGVSLFKSNARCARGGAPPRCINGRQLSFSAVSAVYGDAPTTQLNNCARMCGLEACSLTSAEIVANGGDCSCVKNAPHQACVDSLAGGGGVATDPDEGWTLVVLRARGDVFEGFVNGGHWSSTPPIKMAGVLPFDKALQLRIGVYDVSRSAAAGFLDGDVAEMMVYDRALTPQELDRLAHYMRGKYGISGVRLDGDVASHLRSFAVSKPPGCRGAHVAECNRSAYPYSQDAMIRARFGEPYEQGTTCAPGGGGGGEREEVVTISGWFLFPSDLDTSVPPSQVPAGVMRHQLSSHLRYLKVTVGEDEGAEATCMVWDMPKGHWVCDEDGSDLGELGGIRFGVPVLGKLADNGTTHLYYSPDQHPCLPSLLRWVQPSVGDGSLESTWSTEQEGLVMPTLRCVLPKGDYFQLPKMSLYWHGIRTDVEAGSVAGACSAGLP